MKTKRLLIVFSLILASFILMLYSTYAFAQTAESKSSPPTIQKISKTSYYYNYNITEVQKEPEGGGEAETFYQYNYVRIKGKPTKRKVLDAIEAANDTTEADGNTAVNLIAAESDMKTSILYNKTNAQIATYINEHVTDLQSSKLFLYRLTKEVRDIIRRKGWE